MLCQGAFLCFIYNLIFKIDKNQILQYKSSIKFFVYQKCSGRLLFVDNILSYLYILPGRYFIFNVFSLMSPLILLFCMYCRYLQFLSGRFSSNRLNFKSHNIYQQIYWMGGDTHDLDYYLKCMVGGLLACGLTHTAIVPLDVMKCKKQIDSSFSTGFFNGLSKLKANGQLTLGWGPTLVGYSAQGLGKFGFYEIFKDVYKGVVGAQNADKYKKIGWSIASGSAEVIADLLLCPWEATKLKIQLSRPGNESPLTLVPALRKITTEQGFGGLYKGIAPLWGRQIPYTIVKFVAFEWFVQWFYDNVFTKGKENYSKSTQLGVTFASGYLAGIFCAVVSHPADTLVSKIYSKSNEPGSVSEKVAKIYGEIGFRGLWNGLITRIIMIGTLTGLQWWIYDSFKSAVGLQTSGGSSAKKQ